MIAFRRQANLKNYLIKSKLPPPPRPYPKETKEAWLTVVRRKEGNTNRQKEQIENHKENDL